MRIWDEQLKNHAAHGRIEALETKLDEAHAAIAGTPDLEDTLQRSQAVLGFIKHRLSQADPDLVAGSVLTAIDQQITNATQQVTAYLGNKNVAHIKNNLVENMDAALTQVNNIPIRSKRGDAKQLAEEAANYRDFVKNLIQELTNDKSQAADQLTRLQDQASRIEERLQSQNKQIDTQVQRIDNLVNTQQQTFADSEEKRRQVFAEDTKEAINNFTEQAEEATNVLDGYKKQAADLLQIIGNIGVTGNYKKVADQQRRAANLLRGGAIFFLLLMAAAVGYVIYAKLSHGVTWDVTLYRIISAIIFAVPAGYLGFESNRHRREEIRMRRLELELASLGPFLEQLEPDKSAQIRAALAAKYFGSGLDDNQPGQVSPTNLLELLKQLIDGLLKRPPG